MSNIGNAVYREDIKASLRQAALRGESVCTFVEIIRNGLGHAEPSPVAVLAYLCRTFGIQLPQVLPLRELLESKDEDVDFLRALRICFWFSAHVRDQTGCNQEWDWDDFRERFPGFDSTTLEARGGSDTVQRCFSEQFPDVAYVRGAWETQKAKHVSRGPSDDAILADIRKFASHWRRCLQDTGRTNKSGCRLGFWFDIADQGPYYRVVGCVEALLDRLDRTGCPVNEPATVLGQKS